MKGLAIPAALWCVLLVGVSGGYAAAQEPQLPEGLPDAPEGFKWRTCKAIPLTVLVPDGWFILEEVHEGGPRAVFITRESIAKEGRYTTGFSVNVLRNPDPGSLSAYAKRTIDNLQSTAREARDIEQVTAPPFDGYAGDFRFETPEGQAVTQHVLALGNETTRAFYVFIFESPPSEWTQAEEIGDLIMSHLGLDQDF